MSGPLLSVKDLSWHAEGKAILSDVNFQIQPGRFVGLLGPNGAGKSSLMRCLYRANKPNTGTIDLGSSNLLALSVKDSAKRIAVILQEHTAHLDLHVADIVALGLTPHKGLFQRDSADDRQLVDATLRDLDLWELRFDAYSHLSGGEKQRVMLARAMVQNPDLLIMDEPTNHLDVHYQIDMLTKVKKLGKTVLASFHDLNLALAYCDYLLVMHEGTIVAQGEPAQVMTEDLVSKIFNTCVIVDKHPLYEHPRISYAYHEQR